jgi:hypothetical protein
MWASEGYSPARDLLSVAEKYGRLRVNETRRLRALEGENRRLERVAADQR